MGDNDDLANEAISAVVDDGFIGEDEDDDDYEDLYNDVNVGENFLHSLANQTDDVANPDPQPDKLPDSPPPPPPLAPPEEPKIEREDAKETDPRVSDRVIADDEEEVKRTDDVAPPAGNGTMRINLGQQPAEQTVNSTHSNLSNQVTNNNTGVTTTNNAVGRQGVNNGGGGGTMLFVGDLHWWTTDAEVEAELCKYGAVKEVRFFDEKASGKSKGYAQVEFHDASSANACKEGMNGFVFNGRPCVVAFASPFSIKRMGEAQMNRTTASSAQAGAGLGPVRRDGPLSNNINNNINNKPMGMGNNGAPTGGYQDNNNNNGNFGNNNNRGGFGRGNWGRGNGQGMGGNRGGPMRTRPMMGRGMMGNGFGGGGPMMPPQAAMMGQGFDPSFGGPMGRMGGYGGGFPGGPNPPFSGMMSSFPPVGLPGVAPHVNPAFFGRGMGMNGMGMMPSSGVVEGGNSNMGMWGDPNGMGGWGGEEHGGRVAESSYAEEAVSDYQYGEVSREKVGSGRSNANKEKDREWSGSSDKRYRDDRDTEYERENGAVGGHDQEWQEQQQRRRDDRDVSRERERGGRERSRERDRGGRDRHRGDERERYGGDHHSRYKDRGGEQEYDDEWDNRGRSSRGHNKSRLSQDEGQHFRSRDADYSKRRRLTSE